jgi:hypothetical protein
MKQAHPVEAVVYPVVAAGSLIVIALVITAPVIF